MQVGQCLAAWLHQEGEREQNGIQVHGEYIGLPRVRQELWCAHAGDIPKCRSLGASESQLCRHLLAIVGSQGKYQLSCDQAQVKANLIINFFHIYV